jgi:hypothetical protein
VGRSVSPPGPPGALWTVSLLLWAGAAVVLGEAVRGPASRWLPLWRVSEPVERVLTDLYVGGAAMYLLAALQIGAFSVSIVRAVPIVAAASILYRLLRRGGRAEARSVAEALGAGLANRWTILAIGSALGLFLVEIGSALPVATGNTYDSSLLTTYASLLLQHGNVPLSFQPYGASAILYPQGSTVWFAWAQSTFGLPPARTALLVTPLFLALPPLSGYVLGLRWFGSRKVGAALAVGLAFLGPSTRALVAGSNDFVLAVPLVLLLVARSRIWFDSDPPSPRDAVAFGLLVGYAGALNVVGTEWLLPSLLVLGALASPRFGGRFVAWIARWSVATGSALVAGIPSIYVLIEGMVRPALLSGAITPPEPVPVGINPAQLVGDVDPFLFRGSDVALSPIPIVRAELALLLVLGAAVLLAIETAGGSDRAGGRFGRWALSGGLVAGGWLILLLLARVPGSMLRALPFVTNGEELSMWLFLIYGLIAVFPLALAISGARPEQASLPRAVPGPTGRGPGGRWRGVAPVAFAIVVVVPAVVLTPASLGPVLASTYQDFGNVTAADFALLDHASGWASAGARVLVAPGSAAEFLPGYVRGIVLLYPMEPGWSRANASYSIVVRELSNGTLDATGLSALAALAVDFVVVTGNSTVLWPALWAEPLRAAEVNGTLTFPVVWHQADAWVFDAQACRTGSAGCP